MIKLNTTKNQKVFFDGDLLCDGFFIIKKVRGVEIKSVQPLVDVGTPFATDPKGKINPNAATPNLKKIFDQYEGSASLVPENRCLLTNIYHKKGQESHRLLVCKDGNFWVRCEHLDEGLTYYRSVPDGALAIEHQGQLIGFVMPVDPKYLEHSCHVKGK